MKIERLLAILNLLIERGKMTAPELAEKLEVSRRTINRDIDSLSIAGIPVVTEQGKNGGIYLQEGYTFDKRILKQEELSDIIAGLKGIESVSKDRNQNHLLQARLSSDCSKDIISIDLSSFHKDSLTEKIDVLKNAISNRKVVVFDYYNPKGHSQRCVNPYRIIYRWSAWYLLAWCRESLAYKFFKLNRLWKLEAIDACFDFELPVEDETIMGKHLTEEHPFSVKFSKEVEYLVVELYGPSSYDVYDEYLLFKGRYTDEAYIIRWLLSFGKDAEVLAPASLIEALKIQTKKI